MNVKKYLQEQSNIFRTDYDHRIKTETIYFGSDRRPPFSFAYLFICVRVIVEKVTAHSKNKNQRKTKDKTKDITYQVSISGMNYEYSKKREKRTKRCSVTALWQQNLLNLHENILIHIWYVPLNDLGEQQQSKQHQSRINSSLNSQ